MLFCTSDFFLMKMQELVFTCAILCSNFLIYPLDLKDSN
jgi:hypothetical protein